MGTLQDQQFELLARLCPNTSGAEIRSVCTEAGMFAIRSRRKAISEKDLLDSIEKVINESDPVDVIGYLADMWIVCRLYEIMHDTQISESAAQSQQLEASVQRMKKDKKGIASAFAKAKKGDIDKSMREVFTSRMMTRR